MKKRIVCVLLTLIMLFSLVPSTMLTASAATNKTSEAAITVLKQLEGYRREAYEDPAGSGYWSIGYGTPSEEGKTINEAEADKALRKQLATLDAAVNNFASSNGKSLSQNKHDALVLFSYNCGTAWMSSTGVFRDAVVRGVGANEFLNAIVLWRNIIDTENKGLLNRRLCEANMYLNGVYSNVAPTNYTYVTFDADGGVMDEGNGFKQFYDASSTVKPQPVPRQEGYTFAGWYTSDGAWVRYLTADHKEMELVAYWQDAEDPGYNAVSYKMNVNQFTSRQPKASPSSDAKDFGKAIKAGTVVEIVEDFVDAKGNKWCRVSGTGWLKVGNGTTADVGDATDVTVTVTNSYLNMRKNASITSTQTGKWYAGAQLRIIATHKGSDGFLWGQVAKSAEDATAVGWVALMYTNYNEVKGSLGTSSGTANDASAIATAVVTGADYVNVRSDAGVTNRIVSALAAGTKVNLYEIVNVNGHQWGRTDSGWFCLTYAVVTMKSSGETIITDPSILNYSFTGVLNSANVYKNIDDTTTIETKLEDGATVTVTAIKESASGDIWGKIPEGWVNMDEDMTLTPARYIVASEDGVNVREAASTDSAKIDKLTKGVEVILSDIEITGYTVWGYVSKYGNEADEAYDAYGWVNLDDLNVDRTNAPGSTSGSSSTTTVTGLVATVIGSDKVNVRITGATYGKILGTIARGTTALVIEEKDGWYNLDYDVDGKPETGSWVSGKYLDVKEGTISSGGSTGSTGSTSNVGYGVVSGTYSGVNLRTGPGTGYAATTKLLPGTVVSIQKTVTVGTSDWGFIGDGWVCMDYITMAGDLPEDILANLPGYNGSTGDNGNTVIGSTVVIYTGYVDGSATVYKEADMDAETIREMTDQQSVTIHELIAVVEKVVTGSTENGDGTVTNTTEEVTSYWARTNEGWVMNPENTLKLYTLDDEYFTFSNDEAVKICVAPNGSQMDKKLSRGDVVLVSNLEILGMHVWGKVEKTDGTIGWVRMDYLTKGKVNVNNLPTNDNTNSGGNTTTTPDTGVSGTPVYSTGNIGSGNGKAMYTGKIINNDSVNIRATASLNANVSTTLKRGAAIAIYETVISEGMAWGRCDAGWVYLYYVDMTPVGAAVDARVVYNEGTEIYSGAGNGNVVGSYCKMAVIDIYEIVGKWARTDLGWVHTDNLL